MTSQWVNKLAGFTRNSKSGRIHSMDMNIEEGVDLEKDMSIHKESLRQNQVELDDILEDSPMTRERFRKQEVSLENLSNNLRKIVKLSKQFKSAGDAFRDISVAFGQELQNFDFSNLPSDLEETFASTAAGLGEAILQVGDYQSMFMLQLGTLFTQPLETFLKTDIKASKDLCKQQARLRSKYDASVAKFHHLKDPEKIPEAEHELYCVRREFKLSSLDYASHLRRAQTLAKIHLLKRACAFLYSEKAYFAQGNAIHTGLEPQLNNISGYVSLGNKYIQLHDAILKQKKEELTAGKGKTKEYTEQSAQMGFLFEKKGSKWKRGYYSIQDNLLVRLNGVKEAETTKTTVYANLLLTTIRPARDVDRRFCFEIVSPTDNFIFQAESEEKKKIWFQIVQHAIASALNKNAPNMSKNQNAGADLYNCPLWIDLVAKDPQNKFCADCNAPDPDWASINLGVLVCIKCSGTHRHMGTHITKIRSITLDAWDKELQKMIGMLGNTIGNQVFEYNVPDGVKATIDSSKEERRKWITEKYQAKLYLQPLASSGSKERALSTAARKNLLDVALSLVAHGVDLNWKCSKRNERTAIHVAVLNKNIQFCDFLVQNGANLDLPDAQLWTPLHFAALEDQLDIVILLIRRGVQLELKNEEGKTPLDVAVDHVRAHCVTLLRLAIHAHSEHPGNSLADESFAITLREFSDAVQLMETPEPVIPVWKSPRKTKRKELPAIPCPPDSPAPRRPSPPREY